MNKKAEKGEEEDAVRVQAIDRSYKDVLSTSPFKHRVNLDLYGTPTKKSPKSAQKMLNESLNMSAYSRNKSRTPNRTAKPLQAS